MKLRNFLYLVQLEEYDVRRVTAWLTAHPGGEVVEVKKHLVRTPKITLLNCIARLLFFLPPETSVIFGLHLLQPFDWLIRQIIQLAAGLKLRLFHPRLTSVAVTGSWGKTTAKTALLSVISTKYRTVATPGNQNTLLGICRAVLKLPLHTEFFICEIGAYSPGDIRQICRLLRPHIGLITAVGPMHLERFGSLKNILAAKMELSQSLPASGRLYLPQTLKTAAAEFSLQVGTVIFFSQLSAVYTDLGRFLSLPAAAVKSALSRLPPVDHRLQLIKNGSITILDDTYNSNPAGFELALRRLKHLPAKQRILVTPGMIELGPLQAAENTRLAALAGEICDHVLIVGQTNREALVKGLTGSPAKVRLVEDISAAQTALSAVSVPNSAILFENDLPDNYL
jgi:UDP-N-acetylmuramoyl-tripeptide--D-alanyl-D-alanine ligase